MNGKVPASLDRALRCVFVTPVMHRLHHSADAFDYNANYGVVFSFWDRVLGTLRVAPANRRGMVTYGLEQDGALRSDGLLASLLLPFTLRKPPRQAVPPAVLPAE